MKHNIILSCWWLTCTSLLPMERPADHPDNGTNDVAHLCFLMNKLKTQVTENHPIDVSTLIKSGLLMKENNIQTVIHTFSPYEEGKAPSHDTFRFFSPTTQISKKASCYPSSLYHDKSV
jgi:hypothetical protein